MSNSRKNTVQRWYKVNPHCPECGVKMILPKDVPGIISVSGNVTLLWHPDNMATYEHVFVRAHPLRNLANKDKLFGHKNRLLCKKCNRILGGKQTAQLKNLSIDKDYLTLPVDQLKLKLKLNGIEA